MKTTRTKIVNFPIKVPKGDFCWKYDNAICRFFDNTGGWPSCDIGFCNDETKHNDGVLKYKKCAALKEIQ